MKQRDLDNPEDRIRISKNTITITSEGKIKKGKKLPWYKRLWNWAKNLF